MNARVALTRENLNANALERYYQRKSMMDKRERHAEAKRVSELTLIARGFDARGRRLKPGKRSTSRVRWARHELMRRSCTKTMEESELMGGAIRWSSNETLMLHLTGVKGPASHELR